MKPRAPSRTAFRRSHPDRLPLSRLARRTIEPPVSWLMAYALAHPEVVSLAAGFTDSASLPVRDTAALLRDLLRDSPEARRALQYGTTLGDPELRRLTSERLLGEDRAAWRAPRAAGTAPADLPGTPHPGRFDPERMFITSGSQQLLYVLSECLCDPGDIVLVEDPTYFVYLSMAQSHGLECRGVRMTPDGLDLDHLDTILGSLRSSGALRRVKFLYLVSYFQNPTGITTSYARKTGALECLSHYERYAGHPIYLVEDAAYRELRFAGDDVPSALNAPRAEARVIYAGTFSKPFATGVRVGFGLLPTELLRAVLRIKGNHDFGTSNLLQQLLRRALASGRFARHVRALRERYARKAGVLVRSLKTHVSTRVAWAEPRGGLYVWARLPRGVATGLRSSLFREACAEGVLYVPGELCYASDPTRPKPGHEMRLSFGGASEREIRVGAGRLGRVLARRVG